ncbi:hypothetical protein GF345_04120 [Candidatus Woesearchaeota archaeon]|nr:hypothetical protein [Candidatus Woesearchaeota archaeon]
MSNMRPQGKQYSQQGYQKSSYQPGSAPAVEQKPLINLWWVIGFAAVLLIVILYFTVFTSEKAEEDTCFMELGDCPDFIVTPDYVSFAVWNELGFDITIKDIEVDGCGGDPWLSEPVSIPAGSAGRLEIYGCDMEVDEQAHLDMELYYTDEATGELEYVSGQINAMVTGYD